MNEIPLIIQMLREPISENTRKIRRELLVASTIGIVIVYAGLVPTKIAALGIELTASNQASFRYVIAGVVIYLAAAFLIYVFSEIIAWASLFRGLNLEEMLERADEEVKRAVKDLKAAQKRVDATSMETGEIEFPKLTGQEELLHRIAEANRSLDIESKKIKNLQDQRSAMEEMFHILKYGDSRSLLKPMSLLRMFFETVVPLALAMFAVLSLMEW